EPLHCTIRKRRQTAVQGQRVIDVGEHDPDMTTLCGRKRGQWPQARVICHAVSGAIVIRGAWANGVRHGSLSRQRLSRGWQLPLRSRDADSPTDGHHRGPCCKANLKMWWL